MTIPRMNLDLAPLSFSQQRVLFIEQLEAGTSLYHMPYLMKLKPEILLPQLYEAFRLVIQRHEPLHRIVINADDGENYTQSSDFLLKDNLRKISD
ncbi:condensation domain-containing protein, partial [Pseudoalteromonas citrea]